MNPAFFVRYSNLGKQNRRAKVTRMADPESGGRAFPSVTHCLNMSYILAIGGRDAARDSATANQNLSTVECYDVKRDSWSTEFPLLTEARSNHSSCALADFVYSFCGYSTLEKKNLSSIERINARDAILAPSLISQLKWHVLSLQPSAADSGIEACCNPMVAPVGQDELLVLGGDNF